MKDLTKGKPTQVILLFALPILLGNVLQLTYSLIDTRIVGQYLGEEALAAIGATSSLYTMMISFLNGLVNGFAVIVARYFGAAEKRGLQRAVAGSVSLGTEIVIVMTIISLLILRPVLHLLHTPEEIYEISYQYISIVLAGMPILLWYNVSAGVLRAVGDTVTPLLFLAFSTVLNIFGDIFCIRVLGLGVRGAAIATVVSQLVAMTACCIYMYKRYPELHFPLHDLLFRLRPWQNPKKKHTRMEKRANTNLRLLLDLLGCGVSMALMGCLVNIGSVALQTGINRLGEELITAQMAARKLTELYMLMFSLLGSTMATYAGQNFGAGQYERIRKGMWSALTISWIWCALIILCSYTPINTFLLQAVTATDNKVIIENAALYLRIDTLLYFVPVVICILRNTMQGIGDHVTPILSSFIECVGKILIVIFLVPYLHYMGIILSEPIVWVLMVLPLIIRCMKNPILRKEKAKAE